MMTAAPAQPATPYPPVSLLRGQRKVAHAHRTVDLLAAERAAADLLRALGLEVGSEAMSETPQRMARAYAELFSAPAFDLTTFPNDEGYDELVLARDIPFRSVCEHHLLPFVGVAHVGYLPGERILGLSKLARVVELFARAPQVQERLTKQVADWLSQHLRAKGGRRCHSSRTHVHDGTRGQGDRLVDRHVGAARMAPR